ncbi:hypothetical protein O181_070334 [Austropuccinia psidii MF-1]|uniref:HD/PDEase domain-containing protein n=1 Tax=Austropuccinia psidii MF-1 TaxID=1389203 RepID=A0A9Q3I9E0_9BASI|nr:hypothetical protein [Austropuccinia psidii MF-1]
MDSSTTTVDSANFSLNMTGTNKNSSAQTSQTACEIHDPIYGTVIIDSLCAIEIIHLAEFQRLKHVLQHGISGLVGLLPSPPVNRFDHSLGAMILVKRLGGSEEAQLAALLHDVAHTTFSHVVDLVFGYVVHEVDKLEYLNSTQIPNVLQKHGFDPQRVFNEELFSLLELPSPRICADRVDYALRDSLYFGFLNQEDAQEVLHSLVSIDGQMALDSQHAAILLGNAFLMSDQKVWAAPTHAYLYKLTAEALKLALAEGLIQKKDLWTWGDRELWHLMVNHGSPQIKKLTERTNPRCRLLEINLGDSKDSQASNHISSPEVCTLKLKIRTIDPPVSTPDGLKPLSSLDPEYAKRRGEYIHNRMLPIMYAVNYMTRVDDEAPVAARSA